jgi:hypothetical protein
MGINTMPTSTLFGVQGKGHEKRTSGKKGGLIEGKWTRATGISGSVAGQALAGVNAIKITDTVWLVNNVEYISFLEYGTAPYGFSRQAPAGMVRITLAEFHAYVAKAVASL